VERYSTVIQATDDNITWRKHITCWIPKATNTHSECIILISFPLQQWLHERASLLRCMYIACLVWNVKPGETYGNHCGLKVYFALSRVCLELFMPVTIGSECGNKEHRCCLDIKQCRFSLVKLSLDDGEDDDNHVVIKILIIIVIAHIVAVSCSGSILIILWCCTSGRFMLSLTFIGPCIAIYSYNKSQRDALFLNFILVNNSTCFGQIYCWLSASEVSMELHPDLASRRQRN